MQIRTIAIFIIIISGILFLANFVVYKVIIISFYDFVSPLVLSGILAIGCLSFFISLFIGRKFYNLFTRVYTWLTMIWMGFFAYLFLASIISILAVVFMPYYKHYIAYGVFGIAILISIYGVMKAQNKVIKDVYVELTNLPPQWQGRRAVFISDLHVGQIIGVSFIKSIIKKIQEINPDIVFIGGDLFDGSSHKVILESISPLRDLKVPLGIFYVLGNHEGYGSAQKFIKKIEEVGINVLRDAVINIDGVQIIGVDFITTAKKEDFRNVLNSMPIEKTVPTILLKHEPSNIDISEKAAISIQLSGHTHKAQQWPFEYIARMTYGQFTYGLHSMNETQVYTSSGVGTWGPPMRVGTQSEIVVITFLTKK